MKPKTKLDPNQLTLAGEALGAVCKRFGVTPEDLESPKRWAGGAGRDGSNVRRFDLITPRQLLFFYFRKIGISATHAGLLLNRCKSDVTYACRAFQNRLDTEPKIRELWEWFTITV